MTTTPSPTAAATLRALSAAIDAAFPRAAVFAVDAEQKVVFFSPGAERLLGFRAADVVGEHCRKSNRCQQCMMGCGLKERREIDGVPLVLYRDDGSTVAVRKYARAIADDDGAFIGGVEILVEDSAAVAAAGAGVGLPILDDVIDAPVERSGILTRDPAMRRLLAMVENVAKSDVTVLLRGESGTGKELFARLLHDASHRASGPFLALNCAAVAPTLLESEVFGHEKGAFTGALTTHHGYFERADGGTLFLDEVAELSSDVQAKLLRVLETRSFFRVGGTRAVNVDVRVVSATHRALREEVKAQRFREDLMYRLRVVPVFLPPLRERRVDVPLLVDHFVARLNVASKARGGRAIDRVAPDALRALMSWPFPGNVRELKNAIEYAFAVGAGPMLKKDDLPPEIAHPTPTATVTSTASPLSRDVPAPLAVDVEAAAAPARAPRAPAVRAPVTTMRARGRPKRQADDDEHARINQALKDADGDVGRAAALLGMSRATFWRRRQQG